MNAMPEADSERHLLKQINGCLYGLLFAAYQLFMYSVGIMLIFYEIMEHSHPRLGWITLGAGLIYTATMPTTLREIREKPWWFAIATGAVLLVVLLSVICRSLLPECRH